MYVTSPALLVPRRQQGQPRATFTADQWTQGPTSPRAALRPDPAAHQCTGRLVSPARGLGPAALRLRRSTPRLEHSTAPAEHQLCGALLGRCRATPQGRQAARYNSHHAARTAASCARLLQAPAPATRLRAPTRRFHRRPGPPGAPCCLGRLARSPGRPNSPQLGSQSCVGGLGGGARTNTSTHAAILATPQMHNTSISLFMGVVLHFIQGTPVPLKRLKMRLPEVIRYLLVWGVVLSLIVSAPAVNFFLSHEYNQGMTSNLTENGTHEISEIYETSYFVVVSTIVGLCFPLVIGVASSTLIIRSLYIHKRNMEQNLPCFNKPHLEVHFKAAKTVVSQLFIYVFFFLMATVIRQNIFQIGTLEATICWMGLLFTLSVAPILLIMGNTKLRRASERLLLNLQELSWF
ncbi:hypothetical protein NDU88_004423 [Pleurodeles waltl]|uniref:Taste receptor type 2 member 40 n=1 Tax=Pleurodeles waltl TaxID=8319 RepID=A0AAV7PFY9_PLEWA|nr:hypothetical protein NDU88_004423 [Pleurodeles waltl]